MTPEPQHCPKYHTCCAAVCPLDDRDAVHLPGEKVCPYLTASGKPEAEERFQDDPIFAACKAQLPVICARHPDIRRRVEAAARTGFRGKNLIGKAADVASKPVFDALTLGSRTPDDILLVPVPSGSCQ